MFTNAGLVIRLIVALLFLLAGMMMVLSRGRMRLGSAMIIVGGSLFLAGELYGMMVLRPFFGRFFDEQWHVQNDIVDVLSTFGLLLCAGGLVAQTILAIWFHLRFGASLSSLGLLFFCVNIMAALSCLTAPWLTRQLGLLKAMIIPHFISNIFLLLVPFMPTFLLAVTFLLLRQTLSKLDVPARQAYTMMLVSPEERTAAASFTTTSRSVAVSTSPLVSGLMLSGSIITLGLPILLASCIEISYDAILWIVFRQVPLDITAKAERKLSTQFHHLHFPVRATYTYSPSWHFAQPLHFGQETLSPRFQPTCTPQTTTSEQFWFLHLPSATTPYRVDPIAAERVQDSSAGF